MNVVQVKLAEEEPPLREELVAEKRLLGYVQRLKTALGSRLKTVIRRDVFRPGSTGWEAAAYRLGDEYIVVRIPFENAEWGRLSVTINTIDGSCVSYPQGQDIPIVELCRAVHLLALNLEFEQNAGPITGRAMAFAAKWGWKRLYYFAHSLSKIGRPYEKHVQKEPAQQNS